MTRKQSNIFKLLLIVILIVLPLIGFKIGLTVQKAANLDSLLKVETEKEEMPKETNLEEYVLLKPFTHEPILPDPITQEKTIHYANLYSSNPNKKNISFR